MRKVPVLTRRRIAWSIAVILFAAALAVGFGAWKGGYRAYIIHTGSMRQTLVPGDLVIDRPVDDGGYHTGDIITFRHSAGPDLVTHRIRTVTAQGIHTKGDANPTADVWTIAPSMVRGVVQFKVPYLGYAAVFFKQRTGVAAAVTITIGLVLAWGLFFPPTDPDPRPTETEQDVDEHNDVLV
ncbi:signal peptidase I [Leekyejoonella antrihumi]|uniref:Signal peptidase I n=1 Tax=Leekyejoonella antrihumi TaxID=1660198 RepID=A0A563EB29_9MICO|nr:signal peptidase I [Leekyejoonella antrihumi]TWP38994.1 signal peptidase I [Leekyejoonella antrihumi]